jgi:hypothetical protein
LLKDKAKAKKQMNRPYFLITIDTEGDDLWSYSKEVTTNNADFIPRFQLLSEKYGFKPTYLTNYEMANSDIFQKFGRRLLKEGNGEIGMHLHAWNSPPAFNLTDDDALHKPYLVEYPVEIMHQKIDFLTKHLESVFGLKMTSHRAGRWSLNETYARILSEAGYLVDSSVTPHHSWRENLGNPTGTGGCNYFNFPEEPYSLSFDNIRLKGIDPGFFEVPVTVTYLDSTLVSLFRRPFKEGSLPARALNRLFSYPVWLRPNGFNLGEMLAILSKIVRDGRDCAVFMLHSSELMPKGSPNFRDEIAIEKLYRDLETLFKTASNSFLPATLTDYFNLRL